MRRRFWTWRLMSRYSTCQDGESDMWAEVHLPKFFNNKLLFFTHKHQKVYSSNRHLVMMFKKAAGTVTSRKRLHGRL